MPSPSPVPEVIEPSHLCCPITQVMFCDPVRTSCTSVYERRAILQHWDIKGQAHDPLSNSYLADDHLSDALDVREEVLAYLNSSPTLPQGWESRDEPALAYQNRAAHYLPVRVISPQSLQRAAWTHMAMTVFGVVGSLWAIGLILGVFWKYQTPARKPMNAGEDFGQAAYYAVILMQRVGVLVWALLHVCFPYLRTRQAWKLQGVVDLGMEEQNIARIFSQKCLQWLALEVAMWLLLLVLLISGLFRYSEAHTGYELNTNVGGPVACCQDAQGLGYGSTSDCQAAFIGWAEAFCIVLAALGSMQFAICYVGFRKVLSQENRASSSEASEMRSIGNSSGNSSDESEGDAV